MGAVQGASVEMPSVERGAEGGLPDSWRSEAGGRIAGQADDATHRGRIAGWGIDACLTCHVDPVSLPEWIALLRQSNVRWLRERGVWADEGFDPGIRERMEALRAAGFNIVAFAGTPSSVTAQREGNQSPEDLLAVYASGFRQGREYAGLVSAWEMSGEPDVGYFRDLPDRLAAYNKAMYLGLHAGAARVQPEGERRGARGEGAKSDELRPESSEPGAKGREPAAKGSELKSKGSQLMAHRSPIVLMGALALPPGPWWERAVANGLLDYTDAYNFHFYGNAEDLTSVIRAHREAMLELRAESYELTANSSDWVGRKRGIGLTAHSSQHMAPWLPLLPLWLTECGVSAMVPGDFLNAERREFQAEFARSTARQALAARDVSMFMPFILTHKDDPHAMTLPSPPIPLPAWDAYAKLTREIEWPHRALSASAGERANPVVVQWMPAEGTASHKVAGTYRVGPNEVMAGEFRIYNFGGRRAGGELELAAGFKRLGAGGKRIEIPAGGYVTVPVIYSPKTETGYFREWIKVAFREDSGRVSLVAFGVERQPEETDFTREPVAVYPLRGDGRLKPPEVNVEGPPFGPWRVFNGLEVTPARRPVEGESLGLSPRETNMHLNLKPSTRTLGAWRFEVAKPINDPLAPTYALGALRGVPEGAQFLRVKLDRPMVRNSSVRVDLVDADGERFTIWENLGNSYGGSSREVWLALADFHPYFWSRSVPGNRRLRPDKVREISLRLSLLDGGSMDVELEWMSVARSPRSSD